MSTEIASTILNQLGGNKFIAMIGSKDFVSDKNKLRMTLTENASKANRLEITYNASDDLYTMRFYKYTFAKFNKKTGIYSEDKLEEIKLIENVYGDQLQEVFTSVTGLYTTLF